MSVDAYGRSGAGVGPPAISGDGRYVGIGWRPPSDEDGFGPSGTYVRDRARRTTELVLPVGGEPSMSADARLVALSTRTAPVPEDRNGADDVYARDRATDRLLRFADGGGNARRPALSPDGRWLVWPTIALYTGGYRDLRAALEVPLPALEPFDPPCARTSAYRCQRAGRRRGLLLAPGRASGTTVADQRDARSGRHARRLGALADNPNTALALDGLTMGASSQWVDVGDVYDFAGRAPFSLEAWIRPRSLNGVIRRIVSKEDASGGYLLGVRDSGLYFSRYQGGACSTARAVLLAGEWAHVAATFDGQTVRLYVNGVRAQSGHGRVASAR